MCLTEQISSIGLFAATPSQCTEDEDDDDDEDDFKFRNLGLSGRPINFVTALIENRAFVNPILPSDLKFTWVRSHIELHRYRTTSFP